MQLKAGFTYLFHSENVLHQCKDKVENETFEEYGVFGEFDGAYKRCNSMSGRFSLCNSM